MSKQVYGLLDDVSTYYLFGYTIIVPLIQTVNTVLYPSELITQEKKLLASYKHLPEKGAGTDDADAQAESL